MGSCCCTNYPVSLDPKKACLVPAIAVSMMLVHGDGRARQLRTHSACCCREGTAVLHHCAVLSIMSAFFARVSCVIAYGFVLRGVDCGEAE